MLMEEGHQLIAEEVLERMARLGLVLPHDGWRERAQRDYVTHLASLPAVYFARGEEDISNVRYWTRGEAWGPPAEDRFPERIRR